MARFQRILSVPMFLTALGLAWILGRQAGVDGMAMGLGAVLTLGLALWWLGRRQERGAARNWIGLVPAAAIAIAMIATVTKAPAPASAATNAGKGLHAAQPFSEERLHTLRAEQKPVFVYFTADWCLSCKVNEKTSIERQEVADAFKAAGVTVLIGDWTDGDPVIGRFIESQGRTGVPLYLYYGPGEAAPRILPQVLTPDMLKALAA